MAISFFQAFFVHWALPFPSSVRLVSSVIGLGSTPQPGIVLQDITVLKALWTLIPPLAPLDTTAPLGLVFLCPALLEQWEVRYGFFIYTLITKISGRGYSWHTLSLFFFCFVNEIIWKKQLGTCGWTQTPVVFFFFFQSASVFLQHCDTNLCHFFLKIGNGNWNECNWSLYLLRFICVIAFVSCCRNQELC